MLNDLAKIENSQGQPSYKEQENKEEEKEEVYRKSNKNYKIKDENNCEFLSRKDDSLQCLIIFITSFNL